MAGLLISEESPLITRNTGIFIAQELYRRLRALEIGCQGQSVLDLGTGTGVLPRNLAPYGARFVGIDLSAEQIRQAELLSISFRREYPLSDRLCRRDFFS